MYNLETETSYLREPSTGVWDYSSGIAVFPVHAEFCSALWKYLVFQKH